MMPTPLDYQKAVDALRDKVAKLEARLSASQIRTEQLEGSLELAEAENKRLDDALLEIETLHVSIDGICQSAEPWMRDIAKRTRQEGKNDEN